jgi:hypothetical protein
MSGPARGRHPAARILLPLACAWLVLAAVLVWTGGFSTRIFGFRLSAHGALRPILVALFCMALRFRWLPPAEQDAVIARGARLAARAVPLALALIVAAVLSVGLLYGARAAGGSDAYGYVSQALLWRSGDLRVHQDFVAAVPWPNADWTFTPLGYRPSAGHTLVPTYAPGLPLLMVMFGAAFGDCGPYLLNPICGALLVLLTYGLGVRLSGRAVGIMAAVLVASSPIVLFMMLWPMSDVPAAVFWSASLLFASVSTPAAAAASGAAAGVAIAIRPNLAPLALFPAALAVWPLRAALWTAARRFAAFGVACLPFVLLVAWFYDRLYGSPLQSGYGEAGSLFGWSNLGPNLARYPRWLWYTEGPLVFAFFLAGVLPRGPRQTSRALRLCFFAFISGVVASYLWYLPYDAWWFLRFLLPAAPLVFVLAADVAWNGCRRFGLRTQLAAALAFTAITLTYGLTRAAEREVLGLGKGEQKYADIGRYVANRLPPNAVVLAMQHSGNVRLYSGRPTLRYDMLEAGWLDRALEYLQSSGYEAYVLLEDWELPLFRERFVTQKSVALVDRPPMAVYAERGVRLFRTSGPGNGGDPDPIPHTAGCR